MATYRDDSQIAQARNQVSFEIVEWFHEILQTREKCGNNEFLNICKYYVKSSFYFLALPNYLLNLNWFYEIFWSLWILILKNYCNMTENLSV